MKKIINLLLITIFSISKLYADEDNDTIVVKLATESKLMPLYMSSFLEDNSGLEKNHIAQLEKILSFDLNHNGMTYTVKHTQEQDQLSDLKNFENMGNANDWLKLNVFYVLKVKVNNKQISARLLSVNSNTFKAIDGLSLSGDLAQDRRQIHRLADSIFKTLFNTDGVANTKIIYTVKTSITGQKPTSEIWEMDYDGGNGRQITNEKALIVTPTYIPPKTGFMSGSIMYSSYKSGQSKLYVASTKDGVGQRLSLLKGNQLMPTVSRQRDKIAFICDYTGNPDLFLQSFDAEKGLIGKPQQIFATHLATQGTPTFSPDGKQIAFVSNKDGSPRIYMMDIPEPGASIKNIRPFLVSKMNRDNTAPTWSPDGTKIAYCSNTQGTRQIWIYDFETNQEQQITSGGSHKENPTWGPNSLHLIFNSTGNICDLYLINLNQPEAVKITKGTGDKRFPCWEPKTS